MLSVNESAIRERAKRRGYRILRSRQRSLHCGNQGEYMMIEADTRMLVVGQNFDASLTEIAEWLRY